MHATLHELSTKLASGEFSSVELTQYYLDRIARLNPTYNAFISSDSERALKEAAAADARRKNGAVSPLNGIPLAVKDIFCVADSTTTAGSKMLANFVAPYDATAAEKAFQDAGMVLIGKCNLDEFAMGSSNENSAFGAVKNPWDIKRVPGGSSGGSAAAVSAAMAPVALGTDTGGSVRQPAAFCGLTGIKPTYGRVSRYGMIAYASSLDQAGILAQSAADAALLLGTIAGFDQRDSTSVDITVDDYNTSLNHEIKGLRIGVPQEWMDEQLNPAIKKLIEDALARYQSLGAELIPISLPHVPLSIAAYYVIATSEASSNLSRFDGVRYGYRCQQPENLEDLYIRSRGEGFGAETKRRILVGTYALSAGYYDAYYLQAQKIRRLIWQDFNAALAKVDVIMGPVAPSTAFLLGEKSQDATAMYLADIYTLSLNLAGLPGMSIPAGLVDGLPVGLQLIGNYWQEARLLNVAHKFQQNSDWHLARPPLDFN